MSFTPNLIAPAAIFLALFASGVNGYINNTSILERADDPCDLNQVYSSVSTGYDLNTLRNILDDLEYASADLYSHYQQLFGCNNMDALQTVKSEMNLPVYLNPSTFPTYVKTYYTWLLWAEEAEVYMNSSSDMGNPSLDFLKLNETVNLMMQLACLVFDQYLEANVDLPSFLPYTDPIEFRPRSCVIFEAVSTFANAALSPLERARRSSFRQHLKRPYKALELNPSPDHYHKEPQATTESMTPFPDSLIDLWTHIKVSGNRRQMNNARGVIPKINGKMSTIGKLLVNLKIKQH